MSGDLGIGRRRMGRSKPEQRLEGRHRGAAAVVAKDELVEVDLKVLAGRTAVGPLEPGLEVGQGPVGARQDHLAVLVPPALGDRPVVKAKRGKPRVTAPAVGVDDRSGLDVGAHPRIERALARVGKRGEPQPSRTGAANLDRNPHEALSDAVSAGSAPRVDAADEALVDLDLPRSGSRSGATIARRSFWSMSQAVS